MKTYITAAPVMGLALLLCGALPSSAQVILSEIHYHPVEEPAFNADGTPFLDLTNDAHEFVEIQNTGGSDVDLSRWRLTGGIGYRFPTNTVLSAGAFAVVAKNPTRLAAVYGLSASTVFGPYSGDLANGSGTVSVYDASGAIIDTVTYNSRFPWPASADALGAQDQFTGLTSSNYQYKGRSLQRVSVTWPSNDPANWLASPLSGPTPGGPQAVTRTVPKPVVIAQSATQTSDGAPIVRASNAVTVNCSYSATNGLGNVTLEYFVDEVDSTTEPRTSVTMTGLGDGKYTASIPGQADRSIVRYRFKADRGDGLEVVSPRQDDPQIAPVGTNGVREAWHGYFVTPVRASANPIYDVFVSSAALATMNSNITQNPRRVTAASAAGVPRSAPYVGANAPQWDGTQPAVFACNGEIWDVQIRYHGGPYDRAAANNSFKLHFPLHHLLNRRPCWSIAGQGTESFEAHKINRLLGLPAPKMRTVEWYYNGNAMITRAEQGEYAGEMLDEYHASQQQLYPGSAIEESGELYSVAGNREASQNNLEGPYTRGDEAPLAANSGWTQLQRYEWTMALQDHGWKGSKPVRDLIEGMWTARGDSPSSHDFSSNATQLAGARAWFTNNWNLDDLLTSMALLEWMSIWNDAAQNHFFWRRANGKWTRLGVDYDQVMSTGGGSSGGGPTQTIYGGEYGAPTVFDGVNWWKDTFFKCFRTEYNRRLWELNNSFFDPANLTAQGLTTAASFASSRLTNVNSQLASLGAYYKPARPVNSSPIAGATVLNTTYLVTSLYSHPQSAAHAATRWEIRTAAGDYEEPILRLTSTNKLTSLAVPFDQLTYGQTYFWRATHIDANGHPSVVSTETSFSWGTASPAAGTLVLNELLANNRNSVANGTDHPDFLELRNNGNAPITLSGFTLSDDPLVPAKFTFPSGTTIAADGYLVVWCDSDTNAPGLHTGFGLDTDGDQVLLFNGATLVDSLAFGPQAPDVSLGRIVNGSGGWQANTPTPGAANSPKPLGAVSSLRINEWMADPAYGNDWFEIHNTSSSVVALSGLYLSDTPSTPTLSLIPALSFIAGGGYTRFWADGTASGGSHCNFKLSKNGESIVLTDVDGQTTLDTVTFGAQATDVSQGRLPDGGSNIVAFSSQTASPGYLNWAPASVCINEVLANASSPFEDAIEIYNPTSEAVNLGGWWLSDDVLQLQKFQIPAGTTLPAGGYLVFHQTSFENAAVPFTLNPRDAEIVLSAVDGSGALTGYSSLVHFGPSPENTSFGRVIATGLGPTSEGAEFWLQSAHTLGQDNPPDVATFRTGTGGANGLPKIGPVIINEIMYHPTNTIDGFDDTTNEFVELFNLTSSGVDLAGWRLKGDSDFIFPAGTVLGAGQYLLLVGFDPADNAVLTGFRTYYGLTNSMLILGPYSKRLANSTHDIELSYPAVIDGAGVSILVDKVQYRDLAPWPTGPDGTGQSLQRISRTRIGNTAGDWQGDAPSPGAANAGMAAGLSVTTTSPLPGGVVGTSCSIALAAAGGTSPYSWTMSPESASGLALSTTGVLSGTPTNAGVFTVSVTVTDAASASVSNTLILTIAAVAPAITTGTSLPSGTSGTAYVQTLTASGGTAPYTWSLNAGLLPPGLTLNGAGVLSGTPTNAGTFAFTAAVADSGGLQTNAAFSLVVNVAPLTVTATSPMVNAELGAAYAQAMTAVGGVTPYSWSLAGGALPGGLSLSSDGTLSGTPTARGAFAFTVQVTDGIGTHVTKPLSLTVVPPPLRITVTFLEGGYVGDACSRMLDAAGGVAPYTWSLASGSLPGGISLSSTGRLSGTFSAATNSLFTARVTDSLSSSADCTYSLTVRASGPLDHFSWDSVPTNAHFNQAFSVTLTARDSSGRVADFDETVGVSAASGEAGFTSPILITEVTDGSEAQFELQNVTSADVDATGWFILLGDSLTDINIQNPITYTLSGTLSAGGLLRITESNSTTAGRLYFGGPIQWSSAAGSATKGWIMLFDAAYHLRDVVTIGWSNAALATLSVLVNGNAVAPAGQWSGNPLVPGTRGADGTTLDSWQRIGTNDSNTASDWGWRHNSDGTDATSFNATNPSLTLPWPSTTPIAITPTNLTLVDGVCAGSLEITQGASGIRLTARDSAGHTGVSAAFEVIGPASQTISFSALPVKTYGDTPFTLTATASSGLPVSYASGNTNVATISGGNLTIVGAGSATITASQPGNTEYLAAASVSQVLVVNPATAAVALADLAATYDGMAKAVSVTTTPLGLSVAVTYNGNAGAPVDAGNYTVVAAISDARYTGGATNTLVIAKAGQTITFDAIPAKTFGDAPFALSASTSSGLPLTFAVLSGPASVSAGVMTLTGAGTVIVQALQSGNSNYLAAISITRSFTVNKATAAVVLGGLSAGYDGTPKPITVTTTPAGLTVVVTYDGLSPVPVNAGSYAVVATINHANYQGGTNGTLVIAKAGQTITFAALPDKVYGDAPFTLNATASSGLAVAYASDNTNVAAVVGNTVTIFGVGTASLTASQAGNTNYLAATNVTRSLTVSKASAKVELASLNAIYDGSAKPVTVTTTPAGLTVTVTYDGLSTVPVNAGSYAVAATINHANYQGGTNGTLVIAKASQTITFAALPDTVYGDAPFTLNATASSGLSVSYASDNTNVAAVVGNTVTIYGAGTANLTASQSGNTNYLAATNVPRSLTVSKASAKVELASLNAIYDGSAKPVTVTPTPAGMTVTVTYDGLSPVPVNAGSYAVVATINHANYQGGTNGTLVIAKASQTITFAALPDKVYGDAPFTLNATASSGLAVAYASDNTNVAAVVGNTVTIYGAGTANLTASQAGNTNYLAAANVTRSLTVTKASAKVELANLNAIYDGSAKPVTVTTTPAGLTVTVTYDGLSTVPVNAGSYAVAATINHPNYQGGTNGTLAIGKAGQTITFAALPDKVYGDAPFTLNATASSGLSVSYASDNTNVAAVVGNTVTIFGAGTANLTASQAGNTNYLAATNVPRSLTVSKASAKVELANLNAIYDGSAKPVTVTTTPAGLTVTVTYDGLSTVPVNAGSYAAAATINHANYQGGTNGTLVIGKAGQTINFAALPDKVYGDAPFTLNATASSGLSVSYASDNTNVAAVVGNTVTILGAGTANLTASQAGNTNYLAATNVTRSLMVSKASAKVELASLNAIYDGSAKPVTVTTTPAGLTVTVTYDGLSTVPVNAGSYAVAATINHANYQGGTNGTLVIGKASQTITFAALPDKVYGDAPFTLNATASSGLSVSCASDNTNVAAVVGNTVTILGAGTASLTASQAGNTNYLAATNVTRSLTVSKASAKVELASLNAIYDGSAKAVAVTTTPVGLTVTVTYDGLSTVPVNAGSYAVATTINHANYQGGTNGTLVIGKAGQTITFAALPDRVYGDAPFTLNATASSGLSVSYASDNTNVVTVSSGTATITGVGTANLTASQSGNSNYLAAASVTQSLLVKNAPGTQLRLVVIPPAPGVVPEVFTAELSATAGSTVIIQCSTNLVDWQLLNTWTSTNGTVRFSDSLDGRAYRFYRAMLSE